MSVWLLKDEKQPYKWCVFNKCHFYYTDFSLKVYGTFTIEWFYPLINIINDRYGVPTVCASAGMKIREFCIIAYDSLHWWNNDTPISSSKRVLQSRVPNTYLLDILGGKDIQNRLIPLGVHLVEEPLVIQL